MLTSLLNFEDDGIIPSSFLPSIIEVNMVKDMKASYGVLQRMPSLNQYNLLYLCAFWNKIASYESVNKMTVSNICTCVCPSLIHVDE